MLSLLHTLKNPTPLYTTCLITLSLVPNVCTCARTHIHKVPPKICHSHYSRLPWNIRSTTSGMFGKVGGVHKLAKKYLHTAVHLHFKLLQFLALPVLTY